jgi:antitoxin VapB
MNAEMSTEDDWIAEQREKEARLHALMAREGLDAIVLRRVSSFAWATAGMPSYVSTTSDAGEAELVVTPTARYLRTSTIEAPRFDRELGLARAGWNFDVSPWFEARGALPGIASGGRARVGYDLASGPNGAVDVSRAIARLRAVLGARERERLRDVCMRTAAAMGAALTSIRRGATAHQIAAMVAEQLVARGVWPTVLQVACDARARAYKHALPTDNTFDRYALVGVCARRHGLVCSMSRAVHVGPVPDDLRRAQEGVMRVDAAMIRASRFGRTLSEVLDCGREAYAALGHEGEWLRHHQGGLAGYEPREELATPGCDLALEDGHVIAFNPSLEGAKSEDTIILAAGSPEIATRIEGWPAETVLVDGESLQRPTILELS